MGAVMKIEMEIEGVGGAALEGAGPLTRMHLDPFPLPLSDLAVCSSV